jgi:hypothetical protein
MHFTICVLFQLAKGGIESVVYKKLLAPFENDMPISTIDGYSRVCSEHKYAFVVPNFLNTKFMAPLPCQLVSLPETSYSDPWGFILSKNSSYKSLISWR